MKRGELDRCGGIKHGMAAEEAEQSRVGRAEQAKQGGRGRTATMELLPWLAVRERAAGWLVGLARVCLNGRFRVGWVCPMGCVRACGTAHGSREQTGSGYVVMNGVGGGWVGLVGGIHEDVDD